MTTTSPGDDRPQNQHRHDPQASPGSAGPYTGYPAAPPSAPTPPPPTAPPGPSGDGAWDRPPTPPGGPRAPRPPSGRGRPALAGALAALVLVAVGFGLARLTDDGPDATADPSVGETAATTEVQGDSEPPPDLIPDDVEEPVVAVAEAVSPSVVQLETPTGGLGSGFVYDDEGHVLTAAHVVAGVDEVRVRVASGEAFEGEVVGADPVTDVAVVQMDGGDVPPVPLAQSSEVAVGQLAVAIGSPFGLDQTVTSGIVSALGRTMQTPGGSIQMVQTDAPINSGNSGGALVDRDGRVIGVNDAIVAPAGGNVGLGFAIPISTAEQVADQLVAGEEIEYPVLGIQGTSQVSAQGAVVAGVEEGSGADEAGLERGDRIVGVAGAPIESFSELQSEILSRQPGDELELTVSRNGTEETVTVTLGSGSRGAG